VAVANNPSADTVPERGIFVFGDYLPVVANDLADVFIGVGEIIIVHRGQFTVDRGNGERNIYAERFRLPDEFVDDGIFGQGVQFLGLLEAVIDEALMLRQRPPGSAAAAVDLLLDATAHVVVNELQFLRSGGVDG